ncbi:hypothetical protein P9F86_09480 [Bacillus altitudinis]|uniref:hypothetical protein n=1 Tax=Bacillus TaxID=1386 RepID=UPI000553E241|nr:MULTISPECIES: hypothetical protein [Bacillus]KOA81551.1 hypothetical protein ACR53_02835 [Bacillus stratosphericus]ATH71121.1 hypothetical protein CFN77_02455 [Bacillus altitudinis]KIL24082.1 hypothetical protein B4133_0600 [Bacillus altitudinis]KRV46053.1 hypothetical protein AS196_11510 [Bacillus sp. TH007]MBU8694514.1 hypothetical protein [Bacillus altitudinis]
MGVKESAFLLKIRGREYFNDELSCLGDQLAEILLCIKEFKQDYQWYVFDVFGSTHSSLFELFPSQDLSVMSTDQLIDSVRQVVQFESGVFIGFQKGLQIEWDLNSMPETEEDEGIQHSLADIEIRAFDFSYFEVYGNDVEIEKHLVHNLNK